MILLILKNQKKRILNTLISSRAKREYLNRKFKDSSKVKYYSVKKIDSVMSKLDPQPKFITKPWLNQKVGFLLIQKFKKYFVQFDMGLGKSKTVMDNFNYARMIGECKRMLVLVPCSSNVDSWMDDLEIHAPNLISVGIISKLDKKGKEKKMWGHGVQVVVCTYAYWLRSVRDGKGFSYMGGKLEDRFDFVVYDESTFIGGPKSKYFSMCRRMSRKSIYSVPMSGTSVGKNMDILWTQQYVADNGLTFGEFGMFKEMFYKQTVSHWSPYPQWSFDRKNTDTVNRMLKHRSIRYEEHEAADLPRKMTIVKKFRLTKQIWQYYEKESAAMTASSAGIQAMESAYTRCRMLCSGYLALKVEGKKKEYIDFPNNPKMEDLVQRLSELPKNRKVIIWHTFQHTGELIQKGLKKAGIGSLRLAGKTRNKTEVQAKFKKAGNGHNILIANEAAAFGLNLQVANYAIFYELIDDPIKFKQMMKRTYRGDQKRKCFFYIYYYKGSIEEKIYADLKLNKKFFNRLVVK